MSQAPKPGQSLQCQVEPSRAGTEQRRTVQGHRQCIKPPCKAPLRTKLLLRAAQALRLGFLAGLLAGLGAGV